MTDKEKAEEYTKEKIKDMKIGNFKLLEIAHLSNGANIYNPTVEHLLKDRIKQAYLDGLAEGFDAGYKKASERAYERQQDLTDTYIRDGEKIKKLGEEISELKEDVLEKQDLINDCVMDNAKLEKENAKLEKENAELKQDKIDFINMIQDTHKRSLIIENTELKAQIECEHKQYLEVRDKLEKQIEYNIELGRKTEKLRCCGNCKNVRYEWGEKVIEGICHECRNYNKWEMKE